MSGTELYIGPSADDDGSIEPRYHVRLPVFDGPMDLLLHLIRKNEVDIYDIPIAEITRQYLETLELMEELNIDLASEFLVMAATLIHIKSKMLLPPPHEDGTTDEVGEDPRNELVARLLEFQRYKEAAQQLHQQEELRAAIWIRPEEALHPRSNGHSETPDDGLIEVDLFELISAFREVLERVRLRVDLVYEREVISIEQMIERLKGRLAPGSQSVFVDLFEEACDRATVIVTFLAILELTRLREIRIFQQGLFGPIHVQRLEEPN
ncbi:MAG TPA: segregation/condensation protein A [Vicinamibacteria bacterium]|nr:segregation/condensation protein A [Vicinamibacteria bacterium]